MVWCHVIGTTLLRSTFVSIVSSSIPSLLLMVQSEPLQTVWYHIALSWCTVVSEVKRWGVQENRISITPNNITLLTVGCPPTWCIMQTQPSISLGCLISTPIYVVEECWNICTYNNMGCLGTPFRTYLRFSNICIDVIQIFYRHFHAIVIYIVWGRFHL